MRLVCKKNKQDILNVKLYCISPDIDEKRYSFKEQEPYGDLVLNYYDEIILYLMPTKYGYQLEMKTVRGGSNSDMYFWGTVEISFIGQLLKKGILEWKEENKDD